MNAMIAVFLFFSMSFAQPSSVSTGATSAAATPAAPAKASTSPSLGDTVMRSNEVTSAKKAKVQTAREIVEEFYKSYVEERRPEKRKTMSLSFSSGFHRLARENMRLCRQKAGTDICGWESHGDIYFDAQEYDPQLSIKSSQLTITELNPEKINVKLNVHPTVKGKDPNYYVRDITFVMLKEVSKYVVDDILYKDKSLLERITQENNFLKNKPTPKAPVKMHE